VRPVATEEHVLLEAIERIRVERVLSEGTRGELAKIFGARLDNALKAIEESKVRRLLFMPSRRVVWLVSGRERDYFILPKAGFCSCEDFYFRVISHEEFLCYHLLAQRLAEVLGRYESLEETDDRYEDVAMKVAREGERPRKLPIRDVENIRRVVAGVLSEEKALLLDRLLETVREAGFPDLTKRHLVAILVADKARRFHSVDGIWEIRTTSRPHE
jgi:predicted nucleic acid-binding Zn finger protein